MRARAPARVNRSPVPSPGNPAHALLLSPDSLGTTQFQAVYQRADDYIHNQRQDGAWISEPVVRLRNYMYAVLADHKRHAEKAKKEG